MTHNPEVNLEPCALGAHCLPAVLVLFFAFGCTTDPVPMDAGLDAIGADVAPLDAEPDAIADAGMEACVDACGPLSEEPSECGDGVDNDGDGLTDCADDDCSASPMVDYCGEEIGLRCDDGIDNDADGTTDCDDDQCSGETVCEPFRLRVVAANLTSGSRQNYDGGHGVRIMDGIDGDVFLVQELSFGANNAAALNTFATRTCGEECVAARGVGAIPNGVVSRFPILESGVWDDPETDSREFFYARIDMPGASDLWAISIHFLTSSGAARRAQAEALVDFVQAEVPEADLVIIGGDFNTASDDVFSALAGEVRTDSRPVDMSGNANTNAPRSRRLDAVFVDRELDALEVPVTVGAQEFPDGLVVDTRVYMPIEDLAPAMASDSAADGMQHMAVVRDFLFEP